MHAFDRAAFVCGGRLCGSAVPQYLVVRIRASKTDPFREGVSVYLGRTKSDLCPVSAILFYMVRRGTAPGPFFRFSDGRCLTRDLFVSGVKSALQAAGGGLLEV